MGRLKNIIRAAALTVVALVVASCTVVVDDGPRPIPIDPRPQFCPRIFDPVCAVNRGDRQTFPNACEADAAGYRVIRGGSCRGDGPGFDRPRPPERPQFCTREYRPVCARSRGNVRTFGNACEAEAAGYRIIAEGSC